MNELEDKIHELELELMSTMTVSKKWEHIIMRVEHLLEDVTMKQLNKHEIVDKIIDYFIEQKLPLDDCLEISELLLKKYTNQ